MGKPSIKHPSSSSDGVSEECTPLIPDKSDITLTTYKFNTACSKRDRPLVDQIRNGLLSELRHRQAHDEDLNERFAFPSRSGSKKWKGQNHRDIGSLASIPIYLSLFIAFGLASMFLINSAPRAVHSLRKSLSSYYTSYTPAQLHQLVYPKSTLQLQNRSSTVTNKLQQDILISDEISVPMLGLSNPRPTLVIAGKMLVGDTYCNIAEIDLLSKEWSLKDRLQLSLYDSYSGGEVYYLLANHTFQWEENGSALNIGSDIEEVRGGELIVVGAFDTTDKNSQTTYCSVGEWDGKKLSKVGEGLCNSALSKGMKITTAALAGPHDVYVAGSFTTQVWSGQVHRFVTIYNIAHYNSIKKIWMPLPVGQISCSWCRATVLALAWDSKRRQLHVAGKFNAIDGSNIPPGLAIYDERTNHLVAHPSGGVTMYNVSEDGVGTALQLDEDEGVLYIMGSFERMGNNEICLGLAAFNVVTHGWTCLADAKHSVLPTGGGNMLLTPFGLMVAGRTGRGSTWHDREKPYTIALLKTTLRTKNGGADSKTKTSNKGSKMNLYASADNPTHDFEWSWLPGFDGHNLPLHALANGFGEHEGTVFIAGDHLVASWRHEERIEIVKTTSTSGRTETTTSRTISVPITTNLSGGKIQGSVMAIAQLNPNPSDEYDKRFGVGFTIAVYLIAVGALLGMFLALLCNKSISQTLMSFLFSKEPQMNGISLDTLTYGSMRNSDVNDVYHRAMKTRCVSDPHILQLIDPQEIMLHRIIGEGTFGRVWSARLNSASVAVKEFVFAQAAVAGRSSHQNEIVEEIIGEAGMMAILRHPNVLQLFGCSLTAQAIWIVSELCSLGSLRHLLDDSERELPVEVRLKIALQVAEGMAYLHNQEPPMIHRDLKSHNILVHETFTEKTGGEWIIKSSEVKRKFGSSGNSEKKNGHRRPYKFDPMKNDERSLKMNSEATIIAKIGDWGSARATLSGSRTMTHGVGTACWLAPEVIKYARSSQQSDVYSYGIILWELATREEVYSDLEGVQIIAKVANDNLRPPVPKDHLLSDLMVKCWAEQPEDRLSFKQIAKELGRLLCELEEQKTSATSSSGSYQNQNIEQAEENKS